MDQCRGLCSSDQTDGPDGGSGPDDERGALHGLLGAPLLRETAVVAAELEDVVAALPLAQHKLTDLHLACPNTQEEIGEITAVHGRLE